MICVGTISTGKRYCMEVHLISRSDIILLLRAAGSDFKDDVINLMVYFSGTIYSGFGDDIKVS